MCIMDNNMGKKKICFFNQSAIHYRKGIYELMDQELDCDFYFGDSRPGGIIKFDYSILKNYKGEFHNKYIGPFYWQKGVFSLLNKYDTIITSGDTYALSSWVMYFLNIFYRRKIYLWAHGAYGNEGFFKKILIKIRASLSSGYLLYGHYAEKIMLSYGISQNKLHVIYNSLDYNKQLELRNSGLKSDIFRSHFENDFPVVIFIGRLTKVKKLHMLLEAMRYSFDNGIYYNIVYIGDGVEGDFLRNKTIELGIEKNVWFFGACYEEKTNAELIYNADLCVAPGNVGLTAMHVMVYGTPVITQDDFTKQMPEFEAIIKGRTGDFFREGDANSLANVIQNWFSTHQDRDIVRQECFAEIDGKWTPRRQINEIINVINK